MKIKTLLLTLSGALALAYAPATATAGTVPQPPPSPGPIAPAPMFGATVSVGYDSHYMFYGVDYGRNSIWGSIEYSLPFTPEGFDLTIGTWYENPVDGAPSNPQHQDELDLYARATIDVAPDVAVFFQYAAYLFPERDNAGFKTPSTNELSTGVEASVMNGMADVFISGAYDFDVNGWYIQTGVSHTESITDFFAVEIGTAIAYQVDYNGPGGDWNDLNLYLAFPLSLTDTAELVPYIKQSWSLNAIDNFQDDVLYGGVALIVSF